jgi:hypothetical protein
VDGAGTLRNLDAGVGEPLETHSWLAGSVDHTDVGGDDATGFDVNARGFEVKDAEVSVPRIGHDDTLDAATGKVSFADVEPVEIL